MGMIRKKEAVTDIYLHSEDTLLCQGEGVVKYFLWMWHVEGADENLHRIVAYRVL